MAPLQALTPPLLGKHVSREGNIPHDARPRASRGARPHARARPRAGAHLSRHPPPRPLVARRPGPRRFSEAQLKSTSTFSELRSPLIGAQLQKRRRRPLCSTGPRRATACRHQPHGGVASPRIRRRRRSDVNAIDSAAVVRAHPQGEDARPRVLARASAQQTIAQSYFRRRPKAKRSPAISSTCRFSRRRRAIRSPSPAEIGLSGIIARPCARRERLRLTAPASRAARQHASCHFRHLQRRSRPSPTST